MPSSPTTAPPVHDSDGRLTEDYVQNAFHSYLKSSLAQAKAERLVDVDMLSSAEGDLMITGPALCLFFAALRCITIPPSVPLPRLSKSTPALDLSPQNCPPTFLPFLHIWCTTVPDIQTLPPEQQHDLARTICGLPPLAPPQLPALARLAADLKAVAIEISQRRSFQDRYALDLQAALDAGGGGGGVAKKASFVPPPAYTPSPAASDFSLPPPSPRSAKPPPAPSPRPAPLALHTQRPSARAEPEPQTPSLLSPGTPAIALIRETLYAALGDVLEHTPSLRALLHTDPPRAYFAAVALAVLRAAPRAGPVRSVLGQELSLSQCPERLRPFMAELCAVGREAARVEGEDSEAAVRALSAGAEVEVPRMERVVQMLEHGTGSAEARRGARRSVEGRAVAFANRVNALALGMTRLPEFRERQSEVFRVLAGMQ